MFGGRGKAVHAILGGLVIASTDNGMGLLGLSAAARYVVTDVVLPLPPSAWTSRRAVAGRRQVSRGLDRDWANRSSTLTERAGLGRAWAFASASSAERSGDKARATEPYADEPRRRVSATRKIRAARRGEPTWGTARRRPESCRGCAAVRAGRSRRDPRKAMRSGPFIFSPRPVDAAALVRPVDAGMPASISLTLSFDCAIR